MKRAILVAVLGAVIVLGAVDAPAAPRNKVSVTCWQNGIPTTQIEAGVEFEIRGTGLRSSINGNVCIFGSYCQIVEVDGTGAFSQRRTLNTAGLYSIMTYQARNKRLSGWRLLSTDQISVF